MTAHPYPSKTDALALLQPLSRRSVPLKMSFSFRGLQFTQEIALIQVAGSRAWFQAAHNRLILTLGARVVLHSPALKEMISAQVTNLNLTMGRLELGEMSRLGRAWVEHRYEEVQPRQPIRAVLHTGNFRLPVALEDLSIGGVGLLAYKPAEHGVVLQVGLAVKVEFDLLPVKTRFSLTGKVANLRAPAAHLTCVGVETYPTPQQARLLGQYIAQRKAEILDELNRVFHETLEPRSAKDLYF